MRVRTMLGVGLVLALVAGLALSAAASKLRAPTIVAQTLRFKLQPAATYSNDVDPAGISIGDELTALNNVLKHGNVVGHLGGACTFTGNQAMCWGILKLNGGQVSIAGQLPPAYISGAGGTAHFAVTGGTGAFKRVRGWATVVRTSAPTQDFTLYLRS